MWSPVPPEQEQSAERLQALAPGDAVLLRRRLSRCWARVECVSREAGAFECNARVFPLVSPADWSDSESADIVLGAQHIHGIRTRAEQGRFTSAVFARLARRAAPPVAEGALGPPASPLTAPPALPAKGCPGHAVLLVEEAASAVNAAAAATAEARWPSASQYHDHRPERAGPLPVLRNVPPRQRKMPARRATAGGGVPGRHS